MIFISHDLYVVKHIISDRIAVMYLGHKFDESITAVSTTAPYTQGDLEPCRCLKNSEQARARIRS